MNRKYLSFLLLFFITVTIGGMFYLLENNYSKSLKSNSDISFENREYKEYYPNKEDSNNNKVDKKLENDKEHIVSYDKNYKVSEEEKDLNEHSKSVDDLLDDKVAKKKDDNSAENRKIKDKRKKTKDSIENNNNIEKEYIKDNNIKKNLEVENVKVFKVDKHSIPKKISRKDKLKLMSIAKNLSISDYFELLEHIKRNDELEAAVDIFRILKDKLDEKEYSLIKEIMNPYMNIQLIEDRI